MNSVIQISNVQITSLSKKDKFAIEKMFSANYQKVLISSIEHYAKNMLLNLAKSEILLNKNLSNFFYLDGISMIDLLFL